MEVVYCGDDISIANLNTQITPVIDNISDLQNRIEKIEKQMDINAKIAKRDKWRSKAKHGRR